MNPPSSHADTAARRQVPPESQFNLRFDKFSTFVEEYTSFLSLGGMFLKTQKPRPVGTLVSFDIKLSDSFRLFAGLGEVVWMRPREEGPGRPAGMGIRFQALDEKGRELVLKILEEQVKGGGEPFDVDEIPPGAVSAAPQQQPAVPPAAPQQPMPEPADVRSTLAAPRPRPRVDGLAAPWGEQLPEVPTEILEEPDEEEPGEGLAALPEPAASAEPAADAAPAGRQAESELEPGQEEDAEFSLALEAADEVDLSSAFEMSDEEDLGQLEAGGEPVSIFEDAAAEEPTIVRSDAVPSVAEPGADAAGFAEPPTVLEEEEPTILSSGIAPAVSPAAVSEPELAEPLPELAEPLPELAEPLPVVSEPPPVVSEPLPVVSEPPPVAAPPQQAVSPASIAAAEDTGAEDAAGWPVDDYEDDVFSDSEAPPSRPAGRLLNTLAESKRQIAVVALLLVTLAATYLFQDQLRALLGLEPAAAPMGSVAERAPDIESPVASPPAAAAADPSGEAVEPAVELEEIDVGQNLPPALEIEPPPSSFEPPAATRPAVKVERISWRQTSSGTVVTVQLDGDLARERFVHDELSYAPQRQLLKLLQIAEPYTQSLIPVGSRELQQIRIGYHPGKPGGAELHIVLDFAAPGVSLAELRYLGDSLELVFLAS